MFNINEFKAFLDSTGVAYSSHFDVQISKPGGDGGDIREMMFRCEASDLPGRTVTTSDISYYGLPAKMAYGSQVSEMTISIILSEDKKEKIFFEEWVDEIVGNYREGQINQNMFDLKYYSDFVGTAIIRRYSPTKELVYDVELREVFPLGISSVNMTWGSDELLRLPISLSYRYYIDRKVL